MNVCTPELNTQKTAKRRCNESNDVACTSLALTPDGLTLKAIGDPQADECPCMVVRLQVANLLALEEQYERV